MWLYRSPIGEIYIKRLSDGSYGMIYNGTVWEACDSPHTEADNVFMQATGCNAWDSYNISGIHVPQNLKEWEEI